MFQYIALLRLKGPQEWIHRECEELYEMGFRFKDKENPQSLVNNLAQSLQHYPMEHALKGPFLMPDYRPDLIEMVLNHLKPDNMVVAVISKSFESKRRN